MTIFVVACALLLLLALAWLGAPLWRQQAPRVQSNELSTESSNTEALRSQLAEAEQELAAGRLEQAAFEETERELAKRMLEEVAAPAAAKVTSAQPLLFVALALFVSALSVGLYLDLGQPKLVEQQLSPSPTASQTQQEFDPEAAAARVAQLRQQLELNAEDPSAWSELARLERRLGDTAAATRSYQHAVMMAADDAAKTELQLEMVETFALHAEQNGGAIPPMALNIVNDVLSRHAEHPRALWYGAMLAESAGQRDLAISRVETLLSLNPPEQIRGALETQLNAWKAEAGISEPVSSEAAAPGREIVVTVDIPNGVDIGNTNSATLFVYARPLEGPRMPLVVWRHESPIFPLQATLEDSLAMMPGTKLAGYDQLEVIARISFTGNAISQPGDWFGAAVVGAEQDAVSIGIDQLVE